MAESNKTQLNRNTTNRKNTSKNTKKRRKKKNSSMIGPLIGLLFGSGIVAIMLLAVLLVERVSRNGRIDDSSLKDGQGKTYSADEEYINIDASSFTAYIGQTYNLTVSSNPSELAQAVVWSSSNEDAVIVDDKGTVRIVGEGVAAITATADTYSSAIAIEGVKDASSPANMGFPSLDAMNSRKDNADNGTQSEGGNSQNGSTSETSAYTYPADGNSGDNSNHDNSRETESASQTASAQDGTAQSTTEESTTWYEIPTEETAGAINTDEMFAVLSGSGFTQYLPNAAIYEVDDDYYGEVIVESDSVHIYIKKRSNDFDMAVRSALAYLLPDTADSVWNTYCTFTSDRTVNSDGRRVRFVMPAANAHSQIIVYNP